MRCFLVVQIRRGHAIAVWKVPADSFTEAAFQLRKLAEHRAGDTYFQAWPATGGSSSRFTVPRR